MTVTQNVTHSTKTRVTVGVLGHRYGPANKGAQVGEGAKRGAQSVSAGAWWYATGRAAPPHPAHDVTHPVTHRSGGANG